MTERSVERRSGLPGEMSSLVWREPQIAALLDSLRAARVVTLTGPGGCGNDAKSRYERDRQRFLHGQPPRWLINP